MKLLLFDVDATLVLTGGAGLRALNRAFRKIYNLDSAMEGVAPHGKTDPAIVREIFQVRFDDAHRPPLQDIPGILDTYVEFLQEEVNLSDSYEVLPGIMEILDELESREGVLLGLATGNVESGARIKLHPGNLNSYFSFGGFGSDSESRPGLVRCAAERANQLHGQTIAGNGVWVIGDTPRDIEAGRSAGFRTVGVATGQYSVDQLNAAGADLSLRDFRKDRDYFLRSTLMA